MLYETLTVMKDSSSVLRDMAFSLDRNSLYVMSDYQVRKRPYFGASVRRAAEQGGDIVMGESLRSEGRLRVQVTLRVNLQHADVPLSESLNA